MANEVYQSKYTAEQIEQKFDDVGSLNTQISSNISELNSLSSENSTQESLLSSLSSSASELNSVASSLSEENSTQNSHLNSLSTENSTLTSEIYSLSTDTSELGSEISEINSEVIEIDGEVSEIGSEIDVINDGLNASIDYTGFDGPTIHIENGYGCIPCATILPINRLDIPKGFLACDGSEYLKSTYPKLASILAALDTEYETTLYAGSDSDHFKVPDLRGEFIRGTGTNSHSNQGSGGNVGQHQDATLHNNIYSEVTGNFSTVNLGVYPSTTNEEQATNKDSSIQAIGYGGSPLSAKAAASIPSGGKYTSRPTNTSENMIIAYKDIYLSPRHEYSTEEQVVGKWYDGRNVYEKIIDITQLPNNNIVSYPTNISNIDIVVEIKGISKGNGNSFVPIPLSNPDPNENIYINYQKNTNSIRIYTKLNYSSEGAYVTIRYTKTTD